MARILVIEDDKIIARTIQIVLKSTGHEVSFAECGEDGVAEVGRCKPELLITDVSLPGIDGIEVLRLVRQIGGVKVVVISGSEASLAKASQAGADHVLEKPFSSQEFIDVVDALVGDST